MLTEVAPGVFGVDHRVAAGKNGIVSGERAALAIDTGHYPDEGQAMADFPGTESVREWLGWLLIVRIHGAKAPTTNPAPPGRNSQAACAYIKTEKPGFSKKPGFCRAQVH